MRELKNPVDGIELSLPELMMERSLTAFMLNFWGTPFRWTESIFKVNVSGWPYEIASSWMLQFTIPVTLPKGEESVNFSRSSPLKSTRPWKVRPLVKGSVILILPIKKSPPNKFPSALP